VVFKQIQHLPEKTTNEFLVNLLKIKECFPDHPKQMLRRSKNWLRRVKKRNKLKKPLPPLPPDLRGDPRLFYHRTYNINLFDYKVRRRLTSAHSLNTITDMIKPFNYISNFRKNVHRRLYRRRHYES
jgi:hypothetical protein